MVLLFTLVAAVFSGGGSKAEGPIGPVWMDVQAQVRIAKWPHGRAAALSLTYDSALLDSPEDREVQALSRAAGVPIDYEFVAGFYLRYADKAAAARALAASGHAFFGHGFQHVNHDDLGYAEAFESFRRTREIMTDFGLDAVAFAYPEGGGRKRETRRALADSGFLSGRMFDVTADPIIAPGRHLAPADWFALPTAVAQDYGFAACGSCMNDSTELAAILDRAVDEHGWVIVTYHSIGRPEGWGFYPMDSFRSDIDEIRNRDLWLGSMNRVTLYLRERSRVHIEVRRESAPGGATTALVLRLADGLRDDRYDVPLTVLVSGVSEWDDREVELLRGQTVVARLRYHTRQTELDLPPDEAGYRLRLARP